MPAVSIPLFPLDAVLFPGGELPLRLVAPRHIDMLRDAARHDGGFGVCLMRSDDDAPATVGTLARIVDFDALPGGTLGLRVRGEARFRVLRVQARDDGLLRGEVAFRAAEPVAAIPAQYGLLATILERLLEKSGGMHANAPRECFDDAGWVGFRLAEHLPLDNDERQRLLQLHDPLERLDRLLRALPRFQTA